MSRYLNIAVLACATSGICWPARCTTALEPAILREYEQYVAAAERNMPGRFDAGELSWVPDHANEAAAQLASGRIVRCNISDARLNRRIAAQNGTVIHWIGAIRIRAGLADLKAVLQDYDGYQRIYRPIVFGCKAHRVPGGPDEIYDVVLGLRSAFRFASFFPQHYAFQVKGRMRHIDGDGDTSALRIHLQAGEIRESDSGEPGRSDFMEPYHDHGIMWAMNEYWRARRRGPDLYLEFESITLARSVQAFVCKLGFVPVPKAIVTAAMDSLPAVSLTVILEATKAECERRASRAPLNVSGQ
jgi:hypothetical protein